MTHVFIGLDGEMSGCDPGVHKLIQIGLALSETQAVRFDIGWDNCVCDPEALAVSGITQEAIRAAPRAQDIDAKLVRWCEDQGIVPASIIAIGWAVSTFDVPFVRAALPRFSSYLHHHCIELNAVCYTMAGAVPYLGATVDRLKWKEMAIKIAEQRMNLMGIAPAWHDAGYDAAASLAAWHWLRAILRDGPPVADDNHALAEGS